MKISQNYEKLMYVVIFFVINIIKSNFEFNLRLQEFIELVRNDKKHDAIKYARKYLSNSYQTNLQQIQRAMATLAFGKDTKVSPYKVIIIYMILII